MYTLFDRKSILDSRSLIGKCKSTVPRRALALFVSATRASNIAANQHLSVEVVPDGSDAPNEGGITTLYALRITDVHCVRLYIIGHLPY
jgi:hypothetical protein